MVRLVALALCGTVGLGAAMRAALAGAPTLGGADFGHVRHAHSHLGVYGVLFPAFLLVAHDVGRGLPGPLAQRGYAAAVIVATAGFIARGYGLVSIAASTVVLAAWLWTAWVLGRSPPQTATQTTPTSATSWTDITPVALVIASLMVPVVGISPRLWPELAQQLARMLTSTLLLGVFVPAALSRMQARPRLPWLYLVAAVLAAVSLGPDPLPALRLFVAVIGVWLVVASGPSPASLETRLAWGVVGIGMVAWAIRLLPGTNAVAIAGVHALILGPLLTTLAPPSLTRAALSRPGRIAWLTVVAVMTAFLMVGDVMPTFAPSPSTTATVVAVLGAVLLAMATTAALVMVTATRTR